MTALLLWLACLASPAGNPREPVLVVLGDSLSAAYGIDIADGWVALLERRLGDTGRAWKVVNASVSGDTTSGGLTRLPRLLADHRPRLVVVELGGNDGLRGVDLATTEANLEAIVVLAREAGARVLLLGMQLPPNLGPAFNRRFVQVYVDVASRQQVPLLPFLLEGIGGVGEMMQDDGIHPRSAAQPRMLDNVWPYLEPLL